MPKRWLTTLESAGRKTAVCRPPGPAAVLAFELSSLGPLERVCDHAVKGRRQLRPSRHEAIDLLAKLNVSSSLITKVSSAAARFDRLDPGRGGAALPSIVGYCANAKSAKTRS